MSYIIFLIHVSKNTYGRGDWGNQGQLASRLSNNIYVKLCKITFKNKHNRTNTRMEIITTTNAISKKIRWTKELLRAKLGECIAYFIERLKKYLHTQYRKYTKDNKPARENV